MTDEPAVIAPGTVRKNPENGTVAIKTALGDTGPRVWFIFDLNEGGFYSGIPEGPEWPDMTETTP